MDELRSINQTLSIVSDTETLYVEELVNTLGLTDEIVHIRHKELDKLPFHINVIESAARGKLRETGHSRILVDLLQHPVLQESFTKLFLGVDLPLLQVDREIGNSESHIDVALYDDRHFVIVENKVNDAEEQGHQVYRYVHDIGVVQRGKSIDNIWVIYLNPSSDTPPSIQTLCNGNPETDVRKLLNERFVVKSFAIDIIDWLQSITIPNEPYLQSAIHQYIDYLQRFFETTDDYKDMKDKIDAAISSHLGDANRFLFAALSTTLFAAFAFGFIDGGLGHAIPIAVDLEGTEMLGVEVFYVGDVLLACKERVQEVDKQLLVYLGSEKALESEVGVIEKDKSGSRLRGWRYEAGESGAGRWTESWGKGKWMPCRGRLV